MNLFNLFTHLEVSNSLLLAVKTMEGLAKSQTDGDEE
jgi:hypothetical protein